MKLIKYLNSLDRGSCHGLSPSLKCNPAVAAAIAPAVVSGGFDLLGNALGFLSNKSANDTNLQIAQYNANAQKLQNEQNYWYTQQLMNQQNDFNYKQYLENRNYLEKYNDPKNVRARLEAAGINPLFAMGNGSGTMSNVSAIQSANPSFNGVAPQMNYQQIPFNPDFSGISQAANAYFQNELLNKQVEGSSIDNQIKLVELRYKAYHEVSDLYQKRANIQNTLMNTKKGSKEYDLLSKQVDDLDNRIKLFNDTFDDLKQREKLQNDVIKAQEQDLIAGATLKRAETFLSQLNAEWFPKAQDAQIQLIMEQQKEVIQRVANLVEEGVLTKKSQVEKSLMNGILGIDYLGKYNVHKASNSNKGMRFLTTFTDYMSSALFKNIKLKGF